MLQIGGRQAHRDPAGLGVAGLRTGKVIKLGMDTREVIARFEAERQALAMMDHPNIARALDAGTTGSSLGVPPLGGPHQQFFRYVETWLSRDNAIPISLSLPLREDAFNETCHVRRG